MSRWSNKTPKEQKNQDQAELENQNQSQSQDQNENSAKNDQSQTDESTNTDQQSTGTEGTGEGDSTDTSSTEGNDQGEQNTGDVPPAKVVDGIRVFKDGDQFCAVDDATFVNLQESPAGFGETEEAAIEAYLLTQSDKTSDEDEAETTDVVGGNASAKIRAEGPVGPMKPIIVGGMKNTGQELRPGRKTGQNLDDEIIR